MEAARILRSRGALSVLRVALAAFVLVWLFGPYTVRATVPVWLAFAIALGLELHLFFGPRSRRSPRLDRLPQAVDRDRYGYREDVGELLLVRESGEELWIPYSGEGEEDVEALIARAREQPDEVAAAPPLHERRGRPQVRQLLVGLAVIAALALIVWVADSRTGWKGLDADARVETGQRLSAEASRVAGHPVTIRCDESGDFVGAVQHADGVAAVGGQLAYLTPERCYDLYRLAFEGKVAFSQTGRAMAVLAHEAWHLNGVRDEGKTECYALQSGIEIGRRLGLSEATARQMMRQQLAENALRTGASAEYRVPPGCRNGGSLDLEPAASQFP